MTTPATKVVMLCIVTAKKMVMSPFTVLQSAANLAESTTRVLRPIEPRNRHLEDFHVGFIPDLLSHVLSYVTENCLLKNIEDEG